MPIGKVRADESRCELRPNSPRIFAADCPEEFQNSCQIGGSGGGQFDNCTAETYSEFANKYKVLSSEERWKSSCKTVATIRLRF